MKVLWITPNIVQGLNKSCGTSKGSGGWIAGTLNDLKTSGVELYAITINKNIGYEYSLIDGIHSFGIPTDSGVFSPSNKVEERLKNIIEKISPDIIDLQGIEFCYSASIVSTYSSITVCTLQGLISNISYHYYSGISFIDILSSITLKDFFISSSIFCRKKKYGVRGDYEIKSIESGTYFIGRTAWDRAIVDLYNPNAIYYKKTRPVSSVFETNEWKYNQSKNTVFVAQSHVPIKGLHILLDAIYFLKVKGFIVNVLVGGRSRLVKRNSLLDSNYERLLRKKIKKYNLTNQVTFLGLMDQEKMKDNMLESNLYLQSSFIENSPNSAIEALALSMPCLLSDVGGTKDLLKDSGALFYRHDDSQLLAYHLRKLLLSPSKLKSMSKQSKSYIDNYYKEYKETSLIKFYEEISSKK